jgi:hypothetical protein
MSYSFHQDCEGPIRGVHLPPYVWRVLRKEGVTTLDQLRAIAHQIHWVPGIGFKTARVIRAELARAMACDKQHHGESQAPGSRIGSDKGDYGADTIV